MNLHTSVDAVTSQIREKSKVTRAAYLARVDAAIVSRTRKIRHSHQRLAAVKNAVKAGVPVEKAKAAKALSKTRKKEVDKVNQPLNRFE